MSTMPRTTRRFQFGLIYLLLLSLVFSVYFPSMRPPHWTLFLCISLGILVTTAVALGVTMTSLFQKHVWKISVTLSLVSWVVTREPIRRLPECRKLLLTMSTISLLRNQ
jgi:predicted Co/Zn/Cd cation transporter (cation efflux family)